MKDCPQCPLFAGLSEEERQALLARAPEPVSFQKGEAVYTARQFRRAVGLILKGRVTVTRSAAVLNRLGPGELFGVAALYGDGEYATRVTARPPGSRRPAGSSSGPAADRS